MKWWAWNAKICLVCSSGDRAGHVSWISETALSISTISFLLRGKVRAIFYLMKCLCLFLSLHQSRCIVGLSILHDHLFQVENFPLSASSSLSLFPFYTDLIIASLEQLWLVVSQFVFMLVVQWSYSVGSLRQGCLVTSSKADCFYFMSVSLAF